MQLPKRIFTHTRVVRVFKIVLAVLLIGTAVLSIHSRDISTTLSKFRAKTRSRLVADRVFKRTTKDTSGEPPRSFKGPSYSLHSLNHLKDNDQTATVTQINTTVHILLNAYHRSGSSFTGRMIASQPRPFYFFEPLMQLARFGVFTADDGLCNDLNGECRRIYGSSEEFQLLQSYMQRYNITEKEPPSRLIQNLLLGIYHCHLDGLHHLVGDYVTDYFTGNLWQQYTECRSNGNSMELCFSLIGRTCPESTVRLIKLVRLGLNAVAPLLQRDPALKVVHLFRDPRGIICSRLLKTDWYPLHIQNGNYTPVHQHAAVLCNRMARDYDAGQRLGYLFPNRFKLLRYEDLIYNGGIETRRQLFQFLGLQSNEYLQGSKVINPSDWTEKLNRTVIRIIDVACASVYQKLGYLRLDIDTMKELGEQETFIPQYELSHDM